MSRYDSIAAFCDQSSKLVRIDLEAIEMDKRNKIIIYSAIFALLALIVVMMSIVAVVHCSCRNQNTEPHLDSALVNNLVDADYLAIGRFAGYLQFGDLIGSNNTTKAGKFLPLELRSVSFRSSEQVMTLRTNCAQLDMHLQSDDRQSYVEQINVSLDRASNAKSSCIVSDARQIRYLTPNWHYACPFEKKFSCLANDGSRTLLLTLVMWELEFELLGNPQDYLEAKFSTPREICSYS